MLRITHSHNGVGAAKYFEEGLVKGDYYATGENSKGAWSGKLAKRLGLAGEVQKDDFVALCHNKQPDGLQLTPRNAANRRATYDCTFSVPKGISVAYAITGDERIRQAFERSVEETMYDIEKQVHYQTGQGKDKHYEKSGEALWASFTHTTARPVDGVSDCHLHRHAVLLNVCWNEKQQRYQALQMGPVKQQAPWFEAMFDARLAVRLKGLGYAIERRLNAKGKYQWDIAGIDKVVTDKFSRRTSLIETIAKTQETKGGKLTPKQKSQLGALTREKKLIGQSYDALRRIWRSRLSDAELNNVMRANQPTAASSLERQITAQEAVARASNSLFERKSAVRETQLKTLALQKSIGDLLPEQIDREMDKVQFYRKKLGSLTYLTTQQAVREENQMLAFLREGKGRFKSLKSDYQPDNPILTQEQKAAIHHALSSRDQVTLITGDAGTGKTTLMSSVAQGVRETGQKIHAFAPTAAAAKVLRDEGFENADTLQQLLHNPKLQDRIKGGVIYLDEVGLVGTRQMNKLMVVAKQQKARILLTGDAKQHASVERGDALSIMQRQGGLRSARVTKIQRQRTHHAYRQVVSLIAKRKFDEGLHQLDRMGWVKEITEDRHRNVMIVADYLDAIKAGKKVLIVAPTHKEGQAVTDLLREQLKQEGQIGKKERSFLQLKKTNWTEEQKTDAAAYQSDEQPLTLEYHQNAKGRTKGERFEVDSEKGGFLQVKGNKLDSVVSLSDAHRFTVYQRGHLNLAKGDKVRITKGGKTKQGSRIYTGNIFTIKGFTRNGDIKLHTGKTLSKDYGHLERGFTTTSHSSQGRSVDVVLVAQSSHSLPASNQQQFYVSVSRGKEKCLIYTDDKQALEQAVQRDSSRLSAREIALKLKSKRRAIEAAPHSYSPTKTQQHGTSL